MKNLKKKKNVLIQENENLIKNINILIQENENLIKNINVIKQENERLKEFNLLKEENENLKIKISSLEEEKLKNKKIIIEKENNDLINEIGISIKKNYILKYLNNIEFNSLNEICIQNNIFSINKKCEDFYDVIIDVKSIKDIKEGWKIKMNERWEKNYNFYKNKRVFKIGVIGNSNKGKSFLLSKISKINLSDGIRTEGLNIKYPEFRFDEYNDSKFVLLNYAGFEKAIIKSEKENENEYFEEKKEKLKTELFLQNFIIYNSDILILVVDILSYS